MSEALPIQMTSRGLPRMPCLPTSMAISSIPARILTRMSASGSKQGQHQKSHSLFPGSSGRQCSPIALLRRNSNFPRSIWWSTTGCLCTARPICSLGKFYWMQSKSLIKKLRSAKAFKAMGDTVAKTLYRTYQNKPDIFTYTAQPINSLEDFKEAFFFSLKDFHKTAIQRCQ